MELSYLQVVQVCVLPQLLHITLWGFLAPQHQWALL